MKAQILKHISIEGYIIAFTQTHGIVDAEFEKVDKITHPTTHNQQRLKTATIYIENEHVRIYASPFWDLEDETKDNSKHLQIDVYIKNKRKYLTTVVEVDWSYNLDRDIAIWATICRSVIATIFIREVDPMEER